MRKIIHFLGFVLDDKNRANLHKNVIFMDTISNAATKNNSRVRYIQGIFN